MQLKKLWLVLVVIIYGFLICSLGFLVFIGKAEAAAIVWTDKTDYFPDAVASVFGYGFTPFANVTLHIVRPDFVEHYVYTVADEFGYFSCEYQLDGVHGTYNLTATDGVHTATTHFDNCLCLKVRWSSCCCWYINVRAYALRKHRSYYVKYFDPDGILRRTSPTYSGVHWFKDNYTILPSLPNTLGWWTVKLYENSNLRRTKSVYVRKMVWTTDSTYNNLVTSFGQGETIYFKTIGLKTYKYYRFQFEKPSGTRFYVGDWTTGVTSLTGSYVLPSDAEIGSWKLHVRQASDSSGGGERHYVDTCYFEVTTPPPPPQHYLTVQTDPQGITTIPGEGWYTECTYVNLTAPELVPGPSDGIRYKFYYWDVDGISQGEGTNPITVHMDENHTATAHYKTQYYLNMTSSPLGVTIPAGSGWYNESDTVPIFAPEFVSITAGQSRYKFINWTTPDMSEIADPLNTSTTVFIDKAKTVTANYIIQYKITFDQTGVGSDFTGTVLTVDGNNYAVANLPASFWWDENSLHSFTFYSPLQVASNTKRYVWDSTSGLSHQQSDTITITTHGNITGNYKTQYYLTLATNPPGVTTPSGEGWYYEGEYAPISTEEFVDVTLGSSRYAFNGWTTSDMSEITDPSSSSTTVFMDKAKTVTANYVVQYNITFDQTGLDSSAVGTVVTVNGASKTFYDLSFSTWVNESDTITYSYENIVSSSETGKRFSLTSVTGPASPITVTGAVTIVGNYKVQFEITFTQSGVNADYTGNVVDIDGNNYSVLDLPISFWWDQNSVHNFTFYSPLIVTINTKQYVWISTSGLSTLQSDSITVSTSGSVTGNYKTQFYLTVQTNPAGLSPAPTPSSGWYDKNVNVTLTAPAESYLDSTKYSFDYWDVDGTSQGFDVNPITVYMNQTHETTAHYKLPTYILTILPSTGGTTDPAAGEYAYTAGTNVIVEAIPDVGYRFDYWILDSSPAGSDNPISVLMDDNHTLEAVFAETHTLIISVSQGGTTDPPPGTYVYETPTNVVVEAIPFTDYEFDHWEYDGENIGSNNPTTVYVGSNHTLVAVFVYSPPSAPLSVSITPLSASIFVGDSVHFTSSVSGGVSPYSYQWYLNGVPVSGANSDTWTFTPTSTGVYYVYLKVTDANNNTDKSDTAKITVGAVPVGGYSVSLTKSVAKTSLICYTIILAMFGTAVSLIRRKRK